ncbi:LysM peptidoglycan-binding domain-containing protein [Glutamicibacter sp. JL.03c]|uniref:LysM peptidoglycan-binding domain-containing protein n=1 Tax=Glutamicibacter sp. JL.03c TaxID=2984842 RepID=UPI0021F7FF44|nr:LysM peptidoglycan-binding domain-containing protein [Glutamicibacter sp. JL.03c]UYQ76389.1 LysM peptidoglycan-binding domain-containing protein [Glutamicibacter sp. JL.03c]
MMRMRALFILFLFSAAGSVLLHIALRSVFSFTAEAASRAEPSSYIHFLISISTLILLALLLMRFIAVRMLTWAIHHERRRVLKFFQWIAPRFSRRILTSLVGTSIVLSSVATANASTGAPSANPSSTISAESRNPPRATENIQHAVPSAQWFPEQISVPISRLVTSGAEPKQERKSSSTETVVAAGENLWSIAATHLGAQATAEEISHYWPRIYKANKHVIGSDPNHLEVGTVLALPPKE